MRPTTSLLLPLLSLLPCVACGGAVAPADDLERSGAGVSEDPRCGADVGVVLEVPAPRAMEARADGSFVIAHGDPIDVAVLTIARWGDDLLLHVVERHALSAGVTALSPAGDAFTTTDGGVWALPTAGPPIALATGRAHPRAVALGAGRAYWSEAGPVGSILVGMNVPAGSPEPIAELPGPEPARALWATGGWLEYAVEVGAQTRIGATPIAGARWSEVHYEGAISSIGIVRDARGFVFGTPAGVATLRPATADAPPSVDTVVTDGPVLELAPGLFHDAPSRELRAIRSDGVRARASGVSGVSNLRAARGCALWLDRAGGAAGAVLAVSLRPT